MRFIRTGAVVAVSASLVLAGCASMENVATSPDRGKTRSGAGYGAAAVAGYPSLTVPMGSSNGLPLGIVFMGTAWSEPRLLQLGYAYEQLTRARMPPEYLPSARVSAKRVP